MTHKPTNKQLTIMLKASERRYQELWVELLPLTVRLHALFERHSKELGAELTKPFAKKKP